MEFVPLLGTVVSDSPFFSPCVPIWVSSQAHRPSFLAKKRIFGLRPYEVSSIKRAGRFLGRMASSFSPPEFLSLSRFLSPSLVSGSPRVFWFSDRRSSLSH